MATKDFDPFDCQREQEQLDERLMTLKISPENDTRAAFVCVHVAKCERSILVARRDIPEDDVDSGWQFHCGQPHSEGINDIKIWCMSEVYCLDRSVGDLLALPVGTQAERSTQGDLWVISQFTESEENGE